MRYLWIGLVALIALAGAYAGGSFVLDRLHGPSASDVSGGQGTLTAGVSSGHSLDLSGQHLTQVPSYVFDRTDLEVLNLAHNSLSGALPSQIGRLQHLKILDLSDNQFTGVPAEIGQLKELKLLNLSGNQITGLPYELGNLTNLTILDISGNPYSTQDLVHIKAQLPSTTIVTNSK